MCLKYNKKNVLYFLTSSLLIMITLEQPGVKAPGTAKTITFLPDDNSAKFTLLVGKSSYKLTDGMLSPTCKIITE